VDAASRYLERFLEPPMVVVRVPGRVNLIGEHTDYSLLPVLPMAIDRGIEVAAGPSRQLEAWSTLLGVAHVTGGGSGYGRYLRAARQVVPEADPVRLVVDADLPATGGLSSSSALTVATVAALGAVAGHEFSEDEVVERAVSAERLTGVEGGSMDQTVIVYAQAGHALRIDFWPPARRHVPLPEGVAVVIGYSGEAAPKGEAARDTYNAAVVGCRAAAALLATQHGVPIEDNPALGRLPSGLTADGLPEWSTPAEVADLIGIQVGRITRLSTAEFDRHRRLPIRRLAAHALAEAGRVDRFETALLAVDVEAMGTLLDESQASLALFGASTPALEKLVGAMRAAGAAGARLTGAGYGGWAMALVNADHADRVQTAAAAAGGGLALRVIPSEGLSIVSAG
jgi:galactokinase